MEALYYVDWVHVDKNDEVRPELIFKDEQGEYPLPMKGDYMIHNAKKYVVMSITYNFDDLEIRISISPAS
jgi:hypothetical protein